MALERDSSGRRWSASKPSVILLVSMFASFGISARSADSPVSFEHPAVVAIQPFAAQAARLAQALDYIGAPLPEPDKALLAAAIRDHNDDGGAAEAIQSVLDRSVLFEIHLDREGRIRMSQGQARAALVEQGWSTFLVKVKNDVGATAALGVSSPQAMPVSARGRSPRRGSWSFTPRPLPTLSSKDVAERWFDVAMFDKPPLTPTLSGLEIEYRILQLYSRDAGTRTATIGFTLATDADKGPSSNSLTLTFECRQSKEVSLSVFDHNGRPTTASFVISDRQGHIYPPPAKRLAPDFAFQKQIYRSHGERVRLPAGKYDVTFTRGPEYVAQHQILDVRDDEAQMSNGGSREGSSTGARGRNEPDSAVFRLRRWIDPPRMGWYSSDHHVHSSGCAHYESPTEGVMPQDIIRHVLGEGLNVAVVLIWGPSYYFQKQFFEGKDHRLSTREHLMHYDVETSGFPSSHTGHLVLLNLKNQDYPDAKVLDDWPTWNLPILRWAKAQGATVGYAHIGVGREVESTELPTLEIPKSDGGGASEFIVDVTHEAVDFVSVADTHPLAELNLWYHTLNAGFRTRISGETDFPCIFGERIGVGRSYVRLDRSLTYQRWVDGIRSGRAYVTDGKSHLLDFSVGGRALGTADSELRIASPSTVSVKAHVAARLEDIPKPPMESYFPPFGPRWDLEVARIGKGREVRLEVVVNGRPVASRIIAADGTLRDVSIDVPIEQSSWVALRILPSSHTNPVFVVVGNRPIRASRASAEWCLSQVEVCWKQKASRIAGPDRSAAELAFEHARKVYRQRIAESTHE
jgi:hypothetical protein